MQTVEQFFIDVNRVLNTSNMLSMTEVKRNLANFLDKEYGNFRFTFDDIDNFSFFIYVEEIRMLIIRYDDYKGYFAEWTKDVIDVVQDTKGIDNYELREFIELCRIYKAKQEIKDITKSIYFHIDAINDNLKSLEKLGFDKNNIIELKDMMESFKKSYNHKISVV